VPGLARPLADSKALVEGSRKGRRVQVRLDKSKRRGRDQEKDRGAGQKDRNQIGGGDDSLGRRCLSRSIIQKDGYTTRRVTFSLRSRNFRLCPFC